MNANPAICHKVRDIPTFRPAPFRILAGLFTILLLSGWFGPATSSSSAATLPTGFAQAEVGGYTDQAVGLTFDAAGIGYEWDKKGRIWIIENDMKLATPLIDLSEEIGEWSDHGLVSVALHPNFRQNGYLYLLYAVDYHHLTKFGTTNYHSTSNELQQATIGRLTRYTALAGDNFRSVDLDSRKILIGEGITNGFPILFYTHGVGALAFGTDGTLLVSAGDGAALSDYGSSVDSYYAQALAEGIITLKENIGAFRPQLVDSLSGKILRIDPDTGDGLPSNPYYDPARPRAARSRVWVLGLRNPYRITVRPGTGSHNRSDGNPGALYIGDVGYFLWEELSIATGPGMNFGWPIYEGYDESPSYAGGDPDNLDAPNPLFGANGCTQQYFKFRDLLKEATLGTPSWPNPCDEAQQVPASIPRFIHARPALDWKHGAGPSRVGIFVGNEASVTNIGAPGSPVSGPQFGGNCSTAGIFYHGEDFPEEYHETYFHGDLGGQWIKNFTFDINNQLVSVRDFASNVGTIVAIASSPTTGGLYYIDYAGWLRKISYVGTGNQGPKAVASSDVLYGPGPLTVRFTGTNSTDPEGLPLTYQWDFGDGSALNTDPNPTHIFNAPAGVPTQYNVTLTVLDSVSTTNTTTLTISVNNTPPNVTIVSPIDGSQYPRTGQTIYNLIAVVTDNEHPQSQMAPVWQTSLHHNNHTHPEPIDTNWTTSAVISPTDCTADDYHYRITLKVTDAAGLTTTASVNLYPDCTNAFANVSEAFSFANLNRSIPDGNFSGISDFRSITSSIASISKVQVKLKVVGNYNGDLYAYLTHSNGFSVLLNRPGKTAANSGGYDDSGIDVTFDDTIPDRDVHLYRNIVTPPVGAPLIGLWQTDARAVDPGTVTDASSRTATLGSFNGLPASGGWVLFLADMEGGATNQLVNWELKVTGRASPTISWPSPAGIVYGTPLSAAQLNASASVPGTFGYSPPAGTILSAGIGQVLTVTFTPNDTNSYQAATAAVNLNVVPAPLTITADDKATIYGAPLPSFTAVYSGFVNGDDAGSLDTPVSFSTPANPASIVGAYPITPGAAADVNYSITFVNGSLTVTKASLGITAEDKTRIYGGPLPNLTAIYAGFVNGDDASSLDTPVSLETTAVANSPAGPYPIIASSAADANYDIAFTNGTLTVTKAPLIVTAENKTKLYGAALPTLTAIYSGFTNGDDASSLDVPVQLSTAATISSSAGSYPILADNAVDANYEIAFSNGTLIVTKASLSIAADSKTNVYGTALPALTASYSGFVNGDTAANLDTPVTLLTDATTNSPTGNYLIVATNAADANYDIAFSNGLFVITKALSSGVLSVSVNPVQPGAPITLTMSLSSIAPSVGTPTGTVQFKSSGAPIDIPSTITNGAAVLLTSSFTAGAYTITADYDGDVNFEGTSATLGTPLVVNTPPVAGVDSIERHPDQGAKVEIATLLSNDADADGHPLSFQDVSPSSVAGGSLLVSGAWVRYTPPVGYTNADSFTYTIVDARGATATGTVSVAIHNDDAITENIQLEILGNGSFRIRFHGIPYREYAIQFSESLLPPSWLPLGTVTTDAQGYGEFTDSPTVGSPSRFYRTSR